MNDEVDAVCFTTAIQVRSLFDFAKGRGYINEVKKVFEERAIAAAVGKVTAEALREEGITRLLAPEIERMGAMIVELAKYYEERNNKYKKPLFLGKRLLSVIHFASAADER